MDFPERVNSITICEFNSKLANINRVLAVLFKFEIVILRCRHYCKFNVSLTDKILTVLTDDFAKLIELFFFAIKLVSEFF